MNKIIIKKSIYTLLGFMGLSSLGSVLAMENFLAKPDLINAKQATILLTFAIQHENKNMVNLLLKYVYKANDPYLVSPLRTWVSHDKAELVNQCLKCGYDPNQVDEKGNTLLHDSANKGSCNVVKLLIGKMADLSAKNKEGKTPLDVAETSHIKCLIQGEIDYRKALARKALEEPVEGIELPCEIREIIIKAANGESI